MNLIIQYYNDSDKERQKEYDECLRKNLSNSSISKIHNIIEKDTTIPEEFKNNKKLINIPFDYSKSGKIKGRLTFKYAFDYSKKNIPDDEVVLISNLDIFLEDSQEWKNIKEDFFNYNGNKLNNNNCLCLSRHEYYWNGSSKMEKCQFIGSSTDVWCFLSPVKEIKDCSFSIGNAPGCDAAIVRRFKDSGYTIFNWAKKYKIYHLDICRGHFNGKMIITNKTDPEGKKALLRGRLDVKPLQNWGKYLIK